MKLKKFLLRYYPPGVILLYEQQGQQYQRTLDLLDLRPGTDVEALVAQIMQSEPLLTENRRKHLRGLILKLVEKQKEQEQNRREFVLLRVLRAHVLPLTNCAFNKSGSMFITGSYDRTCKVWSTATGEELHTLEGHKNVVYAIAFNNPFGDKIVTGSFNKTCKLWDANTGALHYTLRGQSAHTHSLRFSTARDTVLTRLRVSRRPRLLRDRPGHRRPPDGDRVRELLPPERPDRHGFDGEHRQAVGRGVRHGEGHAVRPQRGDRVAAL